MKKEITLGTKITFNATSDKYSIIEQTASGFQFKPVKYDKGLPTVPRTFEEVKDEFLSGEIDIENFEHNDTDNRLVELIMEGYIKASEISSLKDCATDLASEKSKLESQIQENEKTIVAHEATISEQQDAIQEQKDFMQGQKDTIQEQTNILKITKETTIGLEKQISELRTDLEKEKQAHATDKENWNAEEEKYKSTIEGLEASIPEVNS